MPGISVVITSFNLIDYMERCFRRLMEQTFQEFDVLVVDDASTDGTGDIIEKWCKKYPSKFRAIYLKENIGVPGCVRNVALESGMLKGEYILFLDGDDDFSEHMLERMYREGRSCTVTRQKRGADIVICAYDRVDELTDKVMATEMTGFTHKLVLPTEDDLLAYVNTAPWNKLWKRDIIENLRFGNFKVGEEVVFSHKAYSKADTIVFLEDVLIHYKVRQGSVISNTDEYTISEFARTLRDEWKNRTGTSREVFEVVIFLHVGLSMALRAAANPDISVKRYIQKAALWFGSEFSWFEHNRFLKLFCLSKHGIRGIMIWCAYMMYRFHIFGFALFMYQKLGLNVRF